MVVAHDVGLFIRQIATATNLSRCHIHQLFSADDARAMPAWLTHLRADDRTSNVESGAAQPFSQPVIQARVADEVEVVRWCITCLAQLEQGEMNVPPRCL
jgi:AraC-like DNA-binding protein